ncbi:unnamed protein product [Adineta ricciae]|uniref:TNFR-Cys domain-containing protein n=2 Tax=Adineta ricciae TaxID=249248 RepID=A0A815SN31_ADIRI|nr:unnamed protein product [Adineta ricciae]
MGAFSSTSLILLMFCLFSYFVVINGRITITIDSSSSEEGHKPRQKEPCCTDRMKNQDESDIDCGGLYCPKCRDMKKCTSPNDCLSNVCINSTCIPSPSCRDQIRNQNETDIDCGGRTCQKCQDMKTCNVSCDCLSDVCINNTCIPSPSCLDQIQNQDETDIDCGGRTCPKCPDMKKCTYPQDCLSDICINNICIPSPSCWDQIQNQDETDIDCGGSICLKCHDTQHCNIPSDCLSGVCINNECIPSPSCQDQIQNQDETDVDCGGSICPKCGNGKACNTSVDCLSDQCRVQFCQTCSLVSFQNGDFELGTTSGWTVGGGSRTSLSSSEILPDYFLPGGRLYNYTIEHSSIVTNGSDPILGDLMPGIVEGGQYSFRVEDLVNGGYASVIGRQINSYYCLDIYFSWLAVLQNGNHSSNQSSLVIVQLEDITTGEKLILRRYDAGATGSGIDNRFRQKDNYFYTPAWQSEHLAIDNTRFGHDFILTVFAGDCQPTGHVGYIYLDSFSGLSP